MKYTFLQLIIYHVAITQAQVARKLNWTPARVGYLCSPECKGFPFVELWHLKKRLGLSDDDMIGIMSIYFHQR